MERFKAWLKWRNDKGIGGMIRGLEEDREVGVGGAHDYMPEINAFISTGISMQS